LSGLASGALLIKITELLWGRWTHISDKVRARKDAIGQEFNKIYLEGKGHGFKESPVDQDNLRKVILDIEKYDKKLSSKLAHCKSRWILSSMRANKDSIKVFNLNRDDLIQFEVWSREAENLADEIYEEIKRKWTI
jgi:hypothetical protein